MTGRGIDQILPTASHPELHEPAMTDAREYVRLAEMANGRIPHSVGYEYVWGDALGELARAAPDIRIVNLETSVTRSDDWEPKGINYRMHPENVRCLTIAGIDCCVLANNHVLDYGREGLVETLSTLHRAGVKTAGAGRDSAEARSPALFPVRAEGRALVVGIGSDSSGIPSDWAAREQTPGVNLWDGAVSEIAAHVREEIAPLRQSSDIVVASLHWGPNWGFHIPGRQQSLAHALVDDAGVDVVHGHSSHHVKGIEVYRGKLVLYGCGDFINDYEGISGHERYRDDLALIYFADIDSSSGALQALRMVPMRIRRLRLERASASDTGWVKRTLDREGALLGTRVDFEADGSLRLRWR
jgi:poly-gamma-glutamate synthesis protein (capsule biosynthesis protein)